MNAAQVARAPWRRDVSIGMVVLAAAVIIPQAFGDRYLITELTLFFLWATIVTQWNLVFGD